MEEGTIPPVMQDEVSKHHETRNPVNGSTASSVLQVDNLHSIESVANAQDDEGDGLSAEDTSIRDDTTPALNPHMSVPSTGSPPQETTVSPTGEIKEPAKELEVPERSAMHIAGAPSELPTPPAKDNVPVSQPLESSPFPPSEHEGKRSNTPSNSSVGSSPSHRRSLTVSKGNNVSVVLIVSALETIAASKEARRSAPLRDSTQRALDLIRSNLASDHPRDILEPLRLACETRNEKLMIASLDCISKLISYSFFAEEDVYVSNGMLSPPPSPHPAGRNSSEQTSQTPVPQPSIVDLVVHTITACHTETTPEAVSLQIVKALLALVLSPSVFAHHSSLLKTIRTVYNVFLLSSDPVNQMVAQGGLAQMVHHVFTRCGITGGMDLSRQPPIPPFELQNQPNSSRTSLSVAQSDGAPRSIDSPVYSERSRSEISKPGESVASLPQSPRDAVSAEAAQEVDESHGLPISQPYVGYTFST